MHVHSVIRSAGAKAQFQKGYYSDHESDILFQIVATAICFCLILTRVAIDQVLSEFLNQIAGMKWTCDHIRYLPENTRGGGGILIGLELVIGTILYVIGQIPL